MSMVQATEAICCKGCGRPLVKAVSGVVVETSTATVDGVTVRLSPKLCHFLRVLLRCHGQTVHREVIRASLYGYEAVDENILDVMVVALRKRLKGTRLSIATEYGVGYRLEIAA